MLLQSSSNIINQSRQIMPTRDILECILQCNNDEFENQFFGSNPDLKLCLSSHDSFSNLMDMKEESTEDANRSKVEDTWSMESESNSNNEQTPHEDVTESNGTSNSSPSSRQDQSRRYSLKSRRPRNYKNLKESDSDSESSEEGARPAKKSKKIKRKKEAAGKNDSYPTKNLLPAFKSPHFDWLENYLGQEYVNSFLLVQHIKNKDGISMADYENLYKVVQFQQAWREMFACRYLYRAMMLARSTPESKKIHVRKIPVFEEAFKTKIFNRIN